MEQNVIYFGVDVDDNAFHGSALAPSSGEVMNFKTRPHFSGLVKKVMEISKRFPGHEIKCCYEASYIGFSLQRNLLKQKIHCDVISPGSVPRVAGNQVKTDRIDAAKLAQFYASGLLTVVTPPSEEMERDRDLLRSRQFVLREPRR